MIRPQFDAIPVFYAESLASRGIHHVQTVWPDATDALASLLRGILPAGDPLLDVIIITAPSGDVSAVVETAAAFHIAVIPRAAMAGLDPPLAADLIAEILTAATSGEDDP